eukprot:UN31970
MDLKTKEIIGVVPRLSKIERFNLIFGTPNTLQAYCDIYGWTSCIYTDQLVGELKKRNIKLLYVLKGQNTDSGNMTKTTADFEGMNKFSVDERTLHPILSECRVQKTDMEIEYLKRAALVGSQGHVFMMRHCTPGIKEWHMEAYYKGWTGMFGGSRYLSYECICGSGPNGATLHYGHAGN